MVVVEEGVVEDRARWRRRMEVEEVVE